VTAEDLAGLARAVEPIPADAWGLLSRERVASYNDLVYRFRERVTGALQEVIHGHAVEPGLEQELWLLARELLVMRRRAETGTLGEPSVSSD
jgi:hypothetical protein